MQPNPTRRRFIGISAAAAGLALLPFGAIAGAQGEAVRWHGRALGAPAELIVHHHDRARAERLVARAAAEIARLERIFSLYMPDSALSTLNRQGALAAPPPELVELLEQSRAVWALTDGVFDPTVQPLYALYARHFAVPGADPSGPSRAAVEAALRQVDWQAIAVSPERIVLQRPGMAVTLNGIAQGYIADRVGERLAAFGVTDALLALGEIRALGSARDGRPWRAGIAGCAGGGTAQAQPVALGTAAGAYPALATSAAAGTVFGRSGRANHLLDPRTGESAAIGRTVTVAAGSAALADGLSTALAIMTDADGRRLAGAFPGIRLFHSA